jgi:hypothetical protein
VVGSSAISSDHHALAHAAGKLVWKLLDANLGIGNADLAQQVDGFRLGLPAVEVEVGDDGLHQLVFDREQRVQRGHRVLENETDARTAHLENLFVVERGNLFVVEVNLAAGDAAGRAQQLHDAVTDGRLAGAGFADQAEDFAGLEIEADVFDRVLGIVPAGEFDRQVLDA